ncbi:MAG TPA: ATP synthase F1 subunit gamma [Candidatus Saccharimonadales bacterium]|nr:ATP synthase F1 subunit gamma [Candidatus Saccharimonadales bacterium]
MPSLITLKRRIGSIRNTRQITKAMELVSSSKLRRAQLTAITSRAYRQAAYDLLSRLNQVREVERQPLFSKRPVKARLYLVITSNSGLAGAYNANVLKMLVQAINQDRAAKIKSSVITIGNKGAQFVRRIENVELLSHFPAFGDEPTERDIVPVLNTVIEAYRSETVDEVRLLYTDFQSSLTQTATSLMLLPAGPVEAANETPAGSSYMNFEPDVETVIHNAGTRLIQAQIWQALLESLASEHAMRAVAMKNATDNADDLIGDYTLAYNSTRQGQITQEIAEITGGAEALAD